MIKLISLLSILTFLPVNASVLTESSAKPVPPPHVMTQTQLATITPTEALEKLKAGNQRFLAAQNLDHQHRETAKFTSKHGQHPFAVILSCVDSRSVPYIIFDQGLGNILSARVAGNVASPSMIASIQFAVEHAGAKLILVMGHTQCGAVHAACVGNAHGQLQTLINDISPAVKSVEAEYHETNCEDPKLINAIAKQNVINQMHAVIAQNPEIANLIKTKSVMIVGAMHNIKTGKVTFFNSDGVTI